MIKTQGRADKKKLQTPRRRTRAQTRRHHRRSNVTMYRVQAIIGDLFSDVTSMDQVRERMKRFLEDDSSWAAMERCLEAQTAEVKGYRDLRDAVVRLVKGAKKGGGKR